MAAVQAAEDALSVAAEDAGEAVVGAGEVQATIAAARAAARSAMDSLRRGGGGFGGEGNGGAQDIFASRQVTFGKLTRGVLPVAPPLAVGGYRYLLAYHGRANSSVLR